jgi:hypothetical protein
MKYLLNVFIQNNNQELFAHELTKEINQIASKNSINYFLGEQTIIITFNTKLAFVKVKEFFDVILSDLSITHILVPIKTDKMSYWFPKKVEKHLFDTDICAPNTEYTDEEQKMVRNAMFTQEHFTMDFEKFEKITAEMFKKMFNEQKEIPTLDELLDKINVSGMDSLTNEEKDLLTKYSAN